jgi:hypothetical protein
MGSLRTAFVDHEVIRACMNYHSIIHDKTVKPGIPFAWEPNDFMQDVATTVKDTRVLVLVGYSFPYFNRLVDQSIMRKMDGLQRIDIQDPDIAEKGRR